jgi:flavin reductase (DIM6/NTAB) family NADH-FMN oxidoreductase RutF/DNA-binding FadR family transcriptional regulator
MTSEAREQAAVDASGPDREVFCDVVGRLASGVTILTSHADGKDHGMTASAVVSLSLDPPMMLACVHRKAPTRQAISDSGAFAVNVLDEHQAHLAERFGAPHVDKFGGLTVARGWRGVPVLSDALAHLECSVVEDVEGGTHSVFLARVRVAAAREGSPLAYFRGMFGRLDLARDEAAYADLRERVLRRDFLLGQSLVVEALAEELGHTPPALYHALTKLAAQGLVTRERERGYVVAPLDVKVSDDAMDAKCAIELGVASRAVGRATPQELAELRRLMSATVPLIFGSAFVDLDEYLRANAAFHEYHVGLARSEALLESFRRLSLTGIMARSLTGNNEASEELTRDHEELVEAYEASDLARAMSVIERHCERAKETQRRGIERAGGIV